MLGKGIEEFDNLITNDKNPIDYIWNQVKDLNYLYHADKDNKGYPQLDYHVFKQLRILTPKEVLEKGYGICYDQSILIAYLATLVKCPYYYTYMCFDNKSDHGVCFVKNKSKWYYIEPTLTGYRGVHGPFKTPEDAGYDLRDKSYYMYENCVLYWKPNINVTPYFNDKHITFYKLINKIFNIPVKFCEIIYGEQFKIPYYTEHDDNYFVTAIQFTKDSELIPWNAVHDSN